MRNFIIFTMVLAIANTTLFAQAGTIPIGGKNRDYVVHVPTEIAASPALVLGLHPLSGSGPAYQKTSGWDKVADKEKFVVVYPTGITPVSMGGSSMPGWDITGESDVNFMLALIDTMAARYKIDRKRVYSTGYSMGGMLSYVLACRKSDKITAIGSIDGFPVGQNAGSCKPSVPVPVCHVHGATDHFVDIDDLPPWIKKFAEVDGCQSSPKTTTGAKYKKDDYSPCDNGNEVILYTITGMDHIGAANTDKFDFSAADTFWTFFSRHPAPTGVIHVMDAQQGSQFLFPTARYHAGTVILQDAENVTGVRLFDTKGRVIEAWKNIAGQRSLSVRPLTGGVYLLSVNRLDGEVVLRMSVQ